MIKNLLKKIYKCKQNIIFVLIMLFLVIMIPLIIDHVIIANKVPSNLSNTEWFSFLSSYIGGLFGGLATLIAIWITYNQTHRLYQKQEEENETTRRLAIMPFLQIEIDGVECKQNASRKFIIENAHKVIRAVVLTENKVAHIDNEFVYPYRISNNEDVVKFVLEHMEKGYVEDGNIGIVLKEVSITNIGLQAAIVVNCYINNQCVWKFNLGKEQEYRFWIALSSEMLQKRIDITVAFRDLYNNEYTQGTFYEAEIQTIFSVISPCEMKVESFHQSMTTAPSLKTVDNQSNVEHRR